MSVTVATSHDLDLQLPGDRVRELTAPHVNQRIDAAMQASIAACIEQGPKAIERRLSELDREWDVDRALMVTFGAVGGAVFLNGIRRYADSPPFGERRKGLLYLFGTQLGFLTLHGLMGWCPPAAVLRRLGFRTMREIEAERRALEAALEQPRRVVSSRKLNTQQRVATTDTARSKANGHAPATKSSSDESRADAQQEASEPKPASRKRAR